MGCIVSHKSSKLVSPCHVELIEKEKVKSAKGKVHHIKSKIDGKVYHVYYRIINYNID